MLRGLGSIGSQNRRACITPVTGRLGAAASRGPSLYDEGDVTVTSALPPATTGEAHAVNEMEIESDLIILNTPFGYQGSVEQRNDSSNFVSPAHTIHDHDYDPLTPTSVTTSNAGADVSWHESQLQLANLEIEQLRGDLRISEGHIDQLRHMLRNSSQPAQCALCGVANVRKKFNHAGRETQAKRKAFAVAYLRKLAGLAKDENGLEDLAHLRALFASLQDDIEPVQGEKLSAARDLAMFRDAHISLHTRRILATRMRGYGSSFLASEYAVERKKNELLGLINPFFTSHTVTISGKMPDPTNPDQTVVGEHATPVTYAHDVRGLLTAYFNKLKVSGKFVDRRNYAGEVVLCLSGDKGGEYSKLLISTGNVANPNSYNSSLMIGCFKGEETYENLKSAFHCVFKQLKKISSLQLDDGELPVVWRITGDMKWLLSIYGLQCASAMYCCLFCELKYPYTAHELLSGSAGRLRKWSRLFRCAKQYRRRLRNGQNPAVSAQLSLSVVRKPLVHIKLHQVIPSAMHVPMGIIDKLIKMLEQLADSVDKTSLESRIAALLSKCPIPRKAGRPPSVKSKISQAVVKLGEQLIVSVNEKELKECRVLHDIVESAEASTIHENPGNFTVCDASFCVERDIRSEALDMRHVLYTCCTCSSRYHPYCELILTDVDRNKIESDEFVCRNCSGASAVSVAEFAKLIDEAQSNVETTELLLADARDLQSRLAGYGVKRLALEQAYVKLGADRRAWSQSFCGNHMRKLCTDDAIITFGSVFEDTNNNDIINEASTIIGLLKQMGALHQLGKADVLSHEEIVGMERAIANFRQQFADAFPLCSVTPKLHWLLDHVFPYVKHNKTWGLMSEQAVELFHRYFREEMTRFENVRDEECRIHRVVLSCVKRCYLELEL